MPDLPRLATAKTAGGTAARALATGCIALFSLALAAPAQAGRPFNEVEESAVQVALEYWGTAPACLGGFRRMIVTNEEMDRSQEGTARHLNGFASWAPGTARDCRIVLAPRSKREGYAAFCSTVTHEIGHLIRLDNWHSDDPTDVMFSRSSPPTPHCRAREWWMIARSDRLDGRANALGRRCRRLRLEARIAGYRRCSRRVKTKRSLASALALAADQVR